uniref:Uncharacterized protein n=1 Tax=Cucumis melo TaxID=3656 RepID=A0A9I9DH70_CUCME
MAQEWRTARLRCACGLEVEGGSAKTAQDYEDLQRESNGNATIVHAKTDGDGSTTRRKQTIIDRCGGLRRSTIDGQTERQRQRQTEREIDRGRYNSGEGRAIGWLMKEKATLWATRQRGAKVFRVRVFFSCSQ